MKQKNKSLYDNYSCLIDGLLQANHFLLEKCKNNTEDAKAKQEELVFELAHGLQIPLAVLKSEFNLLKSSHLKEKNTLVLEKNLDKLSFFINNVFRLVKIGESDRLSEKEKINLSELILEMTDCFKIVFKNRKIKIISDIDNHVYLFANRKDIIDVVNNIVGNSVKYIANEREVFISLKKFGKKIFFSVKDTGKGISKTDLPFIFNRFYRSKNILNIKGTGLGLAICKKIVEKYNGRIFIDSREGKWTEVLVVF